MRRSGDRVMVIAAIRSALPGKDSSVLSNRYQGPSVRCRRVAAATEETQSNHYSSTQACRTLMSLPSG